MLLGRQGRRETFRGSLLPNVAFWNQKKISRKAPGRWPKDMLLGRQGRRETFRGRRKSPGKRPAGGQRTCCWAAKGAGRRLGAAYCLTLLSETRRKSPGKRPAGGQRTCCWAAKGAGRRLGAAYCLTLLSETGRKSPGKRPAAGQRTCCWAAKGAGRRLGAAYCLTLLSLPLYIGCPGCPWPPWSLWSPSGRKRYMGYCLNQLLKMLQGYQPYFSFVKSFCFTE